jgi:asparagine synthase (glutamine-hydrolysing)
MCGIAGVMWFEPADADRSVLAVHRMQAALRHRGPDGGGVWSSTRDGRAGVAFAHARLAVIDLSETGAQPMRRSGHVVTYNGEIYNFRDVRARLADRGHIFSSASDTEVLLRAWEQWGTPCLEQLEGMWAFGLWREHERRLSLVRDRFGIKPLYYCSADGVFLFASEVRALLASGLVKPRLDQDALWHYLGYQTTATPQCLVDGVRMLEPGSILDVDASGPQPIREYWHPLSACGEVDDGAARARQRVGELLQRAAQAHLVSDVPVGVFLSGGIDSSALVSALHSAGVKPRTFSVVFADQRYDESEYARLVAGTFGADHTELPLSASRLQALLPESLAAIDHPTGDGVNTFVVSALVREQGFKVAWSGLGGDELFGGYPSFRRLTRARAPFARWGRLPEPVRRATARAIKAGAPASVATGKLATAVAGEGTLSDLWPVTRQLFGVDERRRLLRVVPEHVAHARPAYSSLMDAARERYPAASPWALIAYAETRAYMHDVLLRDTDQMSMAHGLEVRVPLLDHELASYVLGLTDRSRGRSATPKALLVESLVEPLPDAVVSRPKRGFTLPFDPWMRDGLRPLVERSLGSQGLAGRGLFQVEELQRLWGAFLDGHPGVTWSRIWILVALNAWMDRVGIEVSGC